jgi:hypothetical protein
MKRNRTPYELRVVGGTGRGIIRFQTFYQAEQHALMLLERFEKNGERREDHPATISGPEIPESGYRVL